MLISRVRSTGVVRFWDDAKGFGFIRPDDGSRDVFFHVKGYRSLFQRPVVGEFVSYELETSESEKPRAKLVLPRIGGSEDSADPSPGPTKVLPYIAVASLPLLPILVLFFKGQAYGATAYGAYVVASVLAFCTFRRDKLSAIREERRVPESTLLTISLLCGWPGALLAQQLFSHKRKKAQFMFLFWTCAVINLIAVATLSLTV